ncbi:3-oxoacyl-ACP reductase [Vagococcus vulneris]|uniref:3-oxoacyl-ACP reductase n=1 Tax=Vagococcus vulneris TaxID=1977869 RepID=A0A430A106_9ENTE|nr:3-oxoacyl-ACP reductase [Vagococcus vulneris]RSU00060.1 3-oxoacyl-ACP reductase [Vagococcus vulneris]
MRDTIRYSEYHGKTVLVSGAASGIGKAQAEAFLKQGAFVFGIDRQSRGLKELKDNFPDLFTFFIGDVTEQKDLEKWVADSLKVSPRIDILLNTAGILDSYRPLMETDESLWDKVYETNLKSYYRLIRLILPEMLKEKDGTIINMTSIAGLAAGGGGVAYTMAKHGVVGLTKQLALDYAANGIHVVGIAPGAIKTPMNAADFTGDAEMAKWVADETPCKRWAEPEEVADLTMFLASQKAKYLQGNIVPIDGGWLLK